jgi:hypothetical protein
MVSSDRSSSLSFSVTFMPISWLISSSSLTKFSFARFCFVYFVYLKALRRVKSKDFLRFLVLSFSTHDLEGMRLF